MSVQLSPEEMQAILELASSTAAGSVPQGEVAERDFAQPTRLGPKNLELVSTRLWGAVKEADREFGSSLRGKSSLALVSVSEVSGEGVTRELQAPFAAGRFEVAGQIGWVFWSLKNAIATTEIALGSDPSEDAEERPLSIVERVVLGRVLDPVVRAIGAPLGVEPSELHFVAEVEELGTWKDVKNADLQRLEIVLDTAELPEETSLRILYPGVTAAALDSTALDGDTALPAHLDLVPLTLRAQLGVCSFKLRDLLELEVGDVLPIDVPVHSPIRLTAEERPFATAQLGSLQGKLAARIETLLDPSPND